MSKSMVMIDVAIGDPKLLRAMSGDPHFHSMELFQADESGHKFKPGETRTLTGLVDFPEFNGRPG